MVCPPSALVIDLSTLLTKGVRSHEAKKIMKEKMKLGDKVRLSESGI
jgi:predicted RNA-binding protein with PUA-like domain